MHNKKDAEKNHNLTLCLHGGTVYTPFDSFTGGVIVKNGQIEQVYRGNPPREKQKSALQVIDCAGKMILPGFIDLHLHGAAGFDFTLSSAAGALEATGYHALNGGTTALAPTLVSSPLHYMEKAADSIARARKAENGPEILGLHCEGPFLNPRYKGAHFEQYLQNPEPGHVKDLLAATGGHLALVTLSPELPGALKAIRRLVEAGVVTALGHSGASLEEVETAAACGLSHAVHTYSTMRRFHHRSPGALGAVLTMDNLSAEIIADGIHTHPAAVKLFFRAKPPEKAIIVTDALAVCGLSGEERLLGDKKIINTGGRALLEDGTIAGSILTMNRALAGAVKMSGLELKRVLPAATINPARVLQVDDRKGSLERGKDADITVIDADYKVFLTLCRGRIVQETPGNQE